MRHFLISTAFAVSAAFVAQSASAATCGAAYANALNPNAGCELGSISQDFLGSDPASYTVNTDALFGTNTWEFIAKDNSVGNANAPDEGNGLSFTATGGLTSGSIAISAAIAAMFDDLVLVFKSANENSPHVPDQYVAFLLVDGVFSYQYASPFNNPNGRQPNPGDISHITLYGSGAAAVVPLPAAGWLLLAGVGGLAAAKRRRKA